mmetsp:Transcript_23175/g.43006  ORF Transcript_23175/g.43006 Transcript_23175/m.43006 type:complete len:115 (-) Transcript_23175:172-516(-)
MLPLYSRGIYNGQALRFSSRVRQLSVRKAECSSECSSTPFTVRSQSHWVPLTLPLNDDARSNDTNIPKTLAVVRLVSISTGCVKMAGLSWPGAVGKNDHGLGHHNPPKEFAGGG